MRETNYMPVSPDRLRRTRETAGIPRPAAAAVIGVHPNALARWESGSVEPQGINVFRFLRFLYGAATFALFLNPADQAARADRDRYNTRLSEYFGDDWRTRDPKKPHLPHV